MSESFSEGFHQLCLLAGVLAALFILAGQGLAAMGSVRAKNAASVAARAVMCLLLTYLAAWLGSLATGKFPEPLILALLAIGPVNGALAERGRLHVPLIASAFIAGVLVPLLYLEPVARWLTPLALFNGAGVGMALLLGSTCCMVVVLIVGPRQGKYNRDGSANMIPGFNVTLIFVGAMVTLIGWTALIGLGGLIHPDDGVEQPWNNVLLSAASAGVVAMVVSVVRWGKVDLPLVWSGVLAGLVAMAAPADSIEPGWAVVTGLVCGICIPGLTIRMDTKFKIDDPGGVLAAHLAGAAIGMLAAGLFASHRTWRQGLEQLGIHALVILALVSLTAVISIIVFGILKKTIGLRVSGDAEYDGLDLSEHDINAHPDFQQTMIKSYHMREA